jgi:hypothetical protein
MNKDAFQWRVLDQTMTEGRTGFADLPPEAVGALADEAVTAARKTLKAAANRPI